MLGHIFSDAPGHVNPTSVGSQARLASLFERVANNPANLRPTGILPAQAEAAGARLYTQPFGNGQVWVIVRGDKIIDAGINPIGSFR